MSFKNLSKTFRYVNENGGSITFDYAHGYLINKPNGIDVVSINLSQTQGINQVGGTVESKTVQPRPVTISGIICGGNERKEALLSVIRPDLAGKLYADDYCLNVHVTETPTIEAQKKFAHFQFSLNAPYPYWQKDKDKVTVATLSGVENKFKFPWNISKSYSFGETIQAKFINVKNNGQLPVPFIVTFSAQNEVVNPRITNVSTGETMILNKTLEADERVVVEITHDRTYVTSSIDGNVRGALDLESNLFRLYVGDNVLKPEAESGLDQLEVEVKFATEIVGVTL